MGTTFTIKIISAQPFNNYRNLEIGIDSVLEKTNGAFDITVFELMGLWGFGPSPKEGIPTDK